MLWGMVIPFTKQSESIDREGYQNTSVVSMILSSANQSSMPRLELKQESMDHQIPAGDNMWTPWYLIFFRANSSNCNQSHFVGLRFAPTLRYPPSLVVGRMKGVSSYNNPTAVAGRRNPVTTAWIAPSRWSLRSTLVRPEAGNPKRALVLLGKKLPNTSLIKFPNQKMWGRKVFRMFLLTVVVYITFLLFDSNGDLSKSFREHYHFKIFPSQYSISLSLHFLVVSYVHPIFCLNKSDQQISPVNLATLLLVAKRRYNSKPSSATSNSATSPVERWSCAKPFKKRVRTNRPVLNGRWRSLLISVANRCTVQISCNIRVLSSRIGQCGGCCIALSIFQLSSNISFTFTVIGLYVCIFIVWYVKKNIRSKYLWKHGQPLTNLQSCFATNYPSVLRILGHNSLACSRIFHITLL